MSKPVLFFNAPRDYYRPVIVDAEEMYSTIAPVDGRERCIQRPPGRYNVAKELEAMPPEYRKPSMVVCQWACDDTTIPAGLTGVDCPKVLLVADTHHTLCPISRSVRLALAQPWDLVVLEFNQRHCHWFADAGVKNIAYIPCFTINPIDIPPPAKRTRGVTFVGNLGPDHQYRKNVLRGLQKRGIKIDINIGVSMQQAAQIYNESLVSLNISLNGDFNLRNFEIAAAGGAAVSDKHFGSASKTLFDSLDCVESAVHFYLSEFESLGRGRVMYRDYWADHSPSHKIAALHSALKGEGLWQGERDPVDVWHRINAYEQVQQLVLMGKWYWRDYEDLPRWRSE